ncbi:GlsB/YeaQ/YmgE family stress response membrane protein [Gymnodinialimonas ulvae]|uniref:GlsB/YeaQ/YmgE family stress response membrane protein n=1 Tax=Gymnodinialimonas ulvae TaxID=3126504 RepID=UPI0030B1D76F
MQGLGLIAAIFVGGLAGWAASMFMQARTGILTNVVLGIVGAIVGNFILGLVGATTSPTWISQGFAGFMGACILIAVIRFLRGR